jgi:hypothetical protein
MADSSVRSVVIKGGAAEDYYKSKGLKKSGGKRKTRKVFQEGGDEPPGPSIQPTTGNAQRSMNLVRVSTPANAKIQSGGSEEPIKPTPSMGPVPSISPTPVPSIGSAPSISPTPAPSIGPAPSTNSKPLSQDTTPKQEGGKLILSGKKQKSKLVLAPPSGRKKSRKIRVQLTGMKKRITRAKTIHKESKEKSIDEIRKILEEAKLIKPSSSTKKVPDEMLRNIYRDYMLLRGRAL